MHRLTLRAVAVLLLLCYNAEPPWTMASLSVKLGIPQGATSYALDRLAAEGLLRRVPHPSDGRVRLALLTQSGRGLCRKLVTASKAPERA
ncbi:MarR family transcriptional regulator [Acidisoma sp. S159]|uniref:MarR family transcriptional regulator n=1 Tax=Acidisoma sp. S159 TaxID=1747225 RepID=UPI00352B481A